MGNGNGNGTEGMTKGCFAEREKNKRQITYLAYLFACVAEYPVYASSLSIAISCCCY